MTQAGRQGSPRNRGQKAAQNNAFGARGKIARGGAKGAPKSPQQKRGERPQPKGTGAVPFANERFGRNLGAVRKDATKNSKTPTPLPQHKPRTREELNTEGVRLQKVMANAGVASRRVCEELIVEGRVEVNGQVVTELGSRV